MVLERLLILCPSRNAQNYVSSPLTVRGRRLLDGVATDITLKNCRDDLSLSADAGSSNLSVPIVFSNLFIKKPAVSVDC